MTEDIKTARTMNADNRTEIMNLLGSKWLAEIIPSFIVGVTAKLAHGIINQRKLPLVGWIAVIMLSMSATFLSNMICEANHLTKNNIIIINSFATMFSEHIFKILFSNFYHFGSTWIKDNLKLGLKYIDKAEHELGTEPDAANSLAKNTGDADKRS